jgi:hypothetical protein
LAANTSFSRQALECIGGIGEGEAPIAGTVLVTALEALARIAEH